MTNDRPRVVLGRDAAISEPLAKALVVCAVAVTPLTSSHASQVSCRECCLGASALRDVPGLRPVLQLMPWLRPGRRCGCFRQGRGEFHFKVESWDGESRKLQSVRPSGEETERSHVKVVECLSIEPPRGVAGDRSERSTQTVHLRGDRGRECPREPGETGLIPINRSRQFGHSIIQRVSRMYRSPGVPEGPSC